MREACSTGRARMVPVTNIVTLVHLGGRELARRTGLRGCSEMRSAGISSWAARTRNRNRPAEVVVSMPWFSTTRSTWRRWRSPASTVRWWTERARRDRRVTTSSSSADSALQDHWPAQPPARRARRPPRSSSPRRRPRPVAPRSPAAPGGDLLLGGAAYPGVAARRQGYDYRRCRAFLARPRIKIRIAHPGIEDKSKLGRVRWGRRAHHLLATVQTAGPALRPNRTDHAPATHTRLHRHQHPPTHKERA